MTKNSFMPTNVTRLVLAWVVIALLTISIMKASAAGAQQNHMPALRPIPALNWNSTF